MDRALVARFGVPFVHLAVFAIDVDRINAEHGDDDAFPTGFEVFLTERYLLDRFDPAADPEARELVVETCEHVIESGQALGAQIPFAVHAAVERGAWPSDLASVFRGWKKKPTDLLRAVESLHGDPGAAARLAAACLAVPVDPPLAAPTREALEALTRAP
jgi:hypothetical protein